MSLVLALGFSACGSEESGGGSASAALEALVDGAAPVAPPRQPIAVAADLAAADRIPAAPGQLAGANVLLITLDTTRADYLGCYGRSQAQTPNIDALARGGVLFERAVTPAPTTLPSHSSMLTGLLPVHHGARTNGAYRLQDEQETLTEVLAAEGYATGAIISAFVLSKTFGLVQGFDHYDDEMGDSGSGHWVDHPERSGDATTDRGLAWLRNHGSGPFFLWMHYFDAHGPYEPPAEYAARFPNSPYDGEIAFQDAQVGRLLAGLRELGVLENTLIVLTADHGESLGQQHETSHGYLLYETVMQVPLIFHHGDTWADGMRIAQRASLVDLAPTVLSLLGLSGEREFDGTDLLQAPDPNRAIYVETLYGRVVHGWSSLYGVYRGEEKYIHGPSPELYELGGDAFEAKNLLGAPASGAAELTAEWDGLLSQVYGDAIDQDGTAGGKREMTAAEREALAGLGYASGEEQAAAVDRVRANPKDMVQLLGRVESLVDAAARNVAPQAEVIGELERLAAERPDFSAPSWHLGDLYRQQKQYDQALSALDAGLSRHPLEQRLLKLKARVLLEAGRGKDAVPVYGQVLSAYPEAIEALTGLAAAHAAAGNDREVVETYKRILPIFPEDKDKRVAFVQAAMRAELLPEAVETLTGMLAQDPGSATLRADLVGLRGKLGDYAGSLQLLREGMSLDPGNTDAARSYALALIQVPDPGLQDPGQAIDLLEGLVARTEGRRHDYLMSLSSAYASVGDGARALSTAERALDVARQAKDAAAAQGIAARIEQLRQGR